MRWPFPLLVGLALLLPANAHGGDGDRVRELDQARRDAEARWNAQHQAELARLREAAEWNARFWCGIATAAVVILILCGSLFTAMRMEGTWSFRLLMAVYLVPAVILWPQVAAAYAPVRAADPGHESGEQFFTYLRKEAQADQRVKEAKETSAAWHAIAELPYVFWAVPHAYRAERGLVYWFLGLEAAAALLVVIVGVSQTRPEPMGRGAPHPKKRCTACGGLSPAKAPKCNHCGGEAFTEYAEPAAPENTRRCPSCGGLSPSTAKVCYHCNAALPAD
jgi:hypothetical protein